MECKLIIDGVELVYNLDRKQVRNINLRIKRDGSIFVSANKLVSNITIENFIKKNFTKILQTVEKFKATRNSVMVSYTNGSKLIILGSEYTLKIFKGKSSVEFSNNELIITNSKLDENTIEKIVNKFLNNLLINIVFQYCEKAYIDFKQFGVQKPQIKFRNMYSRWGSCATQKGILAFSYFLIYAPKECIEYVVYHEFNHFLFPNHSKQYYLSLARFMPDWKIRREVLNKHYSKYCIKK